MLCDDLWSFEDGILGHLSVTDAIRLALVCKYLSRVVKAHCKTCRYLGRISSNEIITVTDQNMFTSLKCFDCFCVNDQMNAIKLRKLFGRWQNWSSCYISTHCHTRKALIMWFTHIKGVERLTLNVHTRDSQRILKLKNALYCFVRRNPQMRQLSIRSMGPVSLLVPFLKLQLTELSLTLRFRNGHELTWLIASIPITVECLIVHNVLTPICNPYFLFSLAQRRHLREITLVNCTNGVPWANDSWSALQYFCFHTEARRITCSLMRCDSVEILVQRKLPFLKTCVIGVPPDLRPKWTTMIPSAWDVQFA